MIEFPDTQNEHNWSVFLFDCPKDKVQKLIARLFDHIKKIVPNSLPNYTMRFWNKTTIKISLRVLRDGTKKEIVTELEMSVLEILRKEHIEPIINPTGEDQKISGWSSGDTLERCKAYNRLSEFVVWLADGNQFGTDDRNLMRHLAINMMFLREAAIIPEQFAYFYDMLTDTPLPQPFPFPLTRNRTEEEKTHE